MKILHISTSDLDGGAARAAYRLHRGLITAGIDSKMLVRAKLSQDSTVIENRPFLARVGSKVDAWPLKRYGNRDETLFSPQWFPDTILKKVRQVDPDIIHLHWTCDGYLSVKTMAQFDKPLVWTLHDMWAFTGGCHYTQGCERYTIGCGKCPQLGSTRLHDLSYQSWQRKAKAWQQLNLTVVTPSQWLAQCAQASPLLKPYRTEVILNGLNTDQYQPHDKGAARDRFQLPQDKFLVLFGAGSSTGETRKGFHHLISALQVLDCDEWRSRLELVVFGRAEASETLPMGFKTHYLGKIDSDTSLAMAYSLADVFVAPSIQDNLPNTVVEALSCGTPCVAFDIGGMPDMIKHKQNGFLAKPFDIKELASGISWTLNNQLSNQSKGIDLSKIARGFALDNVELSSQANKYIQLYQEF